MLFVLMLSHRVTFIKRSEERGEGYTGVRGSDAAV